MKRIPSLIALVLLLTMIAACGGQQTSNNRSVNLAPTPKPIPTQTPAPAAQAQEPAGQNVAQTNQGSAGEITIEGFELGFKPDKPKVEKAGTYKVTFVNKGAILHDITFPDGTKITAEAGKTVSADLTFNEGVTAFFCSIPGHKEAGMKGELTVGSASQQASSPSSEDHSGPAPQLDVQADETAPPYKLFDATAPKLLEGTTHEIDLVMEEKMMTVAPGFQQMVWTFGGTVPGPVIRVKVGDTIRIKLINPAENKVPHSIDFHSSMVAWNDEMTSINPGQEKIYEWKADYAGVWMYHCGTTPTLHHIANGMYGMVIVEPAEGLPPVDAEFAFVQSEWYLGPQKELTSLEKASSAAPAPDFVVFNGVASQYKDNPIQINTGKKVRAFVLNAGPSIDSSFHIVGTIFDTVIKEGVYLTPDNPGKYGAQAVDLAPAQGAIIEFTMAEDGLYPIVSHAFNFVGRGALGLFKAGDGDPKN